ncbi:hypothetical protein [Niabella hibiscisoli]|uniref:hypothetical protein n=1 Tax=Niabella hibiscisoli TaxID=1825928 RepID=UPI001F0D29E0|nr:hypothetical protein [Niabella hibiscisoli]MCH5716362.1 hypothetical protein [Niabella hibiscisoli]
MKWFLFLMILLPLLSCKQNSRNIEPAAYYWKSQFNPGEFEKKRLDSLQVQTLYIKLFDIAWNSATIQALPVAKLFTRDTAYLRSKKIIPTVFITNEVFYKLDSTGVKSLAGNTGSLIQKYVSLYSLHHVPEVQIDCDWTKSTRDKYFYFLNEIKALSIAPLLSATIRLHQVKYTSSSGVPPVDKGLLMCYNMGNLQKEKTANSIIDPEEFGKYQSSIETYPLPLDIGLPLFDWYVLFRDHQYAGLFSSIPIEILNTFEKENKQVFKVMRDTIVNERSLKAGDLLRYENSPVGAINNMVDQLNKTLTTKNLHVALYHCDSTILSKYLLHDLENFYSGLRRY